MMKLVSFLLILNFISCSNQSKPVTYNFDKFGVSLTIDDSWIYEKVDENAHYFEYNCNSEEIFCKKFAVTFFDNTSNLSLNQITQGSLNNIPKEFEKYKIINALDNNINGVIMKVIDYKFQENGIDKGCTTIIKTLNDTYMVIRFVGINSPKKSYLEERTLFLEIMNGLIIDRE